MAGPVLAAAGSRRGSGLIFSASILLLALMGWLSFREALRADEDELLVAHTFQVLDRLEEVVTALTSAESAQRGYLLTLEEKRLDSYPNWIRTCREGISSLRNLISDGPDQEHRLDDLGRRAEARVARLEDGIRIARNEGPEAGRDYVLQGAGGLAMGEFLATANTLEHHEKLLLERRLLAYRRSTVVSQALILGTGILAVVFLSVAVVALRRDVVARRRAEESLSKANAALMERLENIRRRNAEIALLSEMSEMLHACRAREEIAGVIARLMPRLLPGAEGAVYLVADDRTNANWFTGWPGRAFEATAFAPEDCWGLRLGKAHLVVGGVPEPCPHVSPAAGCSICVPIAASGHTTGLLHARRDQCEAPDEQALRILTAAGGQIGLALSNLNLREELREQSIRDPLTGLFNRRYLDEAIARELRRAGRTGHPVAFLAADLDHFKRFNDSFGHAAGDQLLREFARELLHAVRGGDIAGRIGGEEFLVVLPEADRDAARARAEAIRAATGRLFVMDRGRPLGGATTSLGVAVYPEDGDTLEEVLRRADEALYRAKLAGRDRVEMAAEAPTA